MMKCTAVWTGFTGAPGYTNLYFGTGLDALVHTEGEAQTVLNRTRQLFFNIAASLPAAVKVEFVPQVQLINPANGELVGEKTVATTPAAVQGAGAGAYSAASGAAVTWRTATVVAGKKLRGRTFIVPLVGTAYEANGTLTDAFKTSLQAGVTALLGGFPGVGENLAVWHRPVLGAGGSVGQATSGTISDKVAVLRSRRD